MLKKIAKRIDKEIMQAQDYIDQAYLIKNKAPETADLFVTLSKEEIDHAKRLLKEGQRIIDMPKSSMYDTRTEKTVEDYDTWKEKCKVIWEWEHRLAMEYISEIEYKISQFRMAP